MKTTITLLILAIATSAGCTSATHQTTARAYTEYTATNGLTARAEITTNFTR